MLVSNIMQTDVQTISAFATIREALRQMSRQGVKSLVVERREASDAYGIITYGSILRTIVAEEGDIDLVHVYDICAKPAISISGALDARHAARLMVRHDFRRILVIEGNELQGIVTVNDIMQPLLRMADE